MSAFIESVQHSESVGGKRKNLLILDNLQNTSRAFEIERKGCNSGLQANLNIGVIVQRNETSPLIARPGLKLFFYGFRQIIKSVVRGCSPISESLILV